MDYPEYQQQAQARSVESTIQNCIAVMKSGEQNRSVAGAGNTMLAPLLSFLWGVKSRANKQQILSVYKSCWPAYVDTMEMLEICMDKTASEKVIERVLENFRTTTNNKHSGMEVNAIHMVWYWDIMDAQFDTYLTSIMDEPTLPLGCEMRRSVFVFCSQKTTESRIQVEERLKKLIAWAEEKKCSLIVLSDTIRGGVLNEQGVSENYHLAASIVQIQNSKNVIDTGEGSSLTFKLAKRPVWTAAYEKSSKNYNEIVYVSLAAIIQEYQKLDRNGTGREEVIQSQLQNVSGSYVEWLDKLITKHIYAVVPSDGDIAFWGDLPDTEQMRALTQKLNNVVEERRPGFIRRLFGTRDDTSWADAINSVGRIWRLCVDLHYIQAAAHFMNSPRGRRALEEDIQLQITKQFHVNDVNRLQQEVNNLRRELQNWNYSAPYPKPTTGKSLAEYLHECACVEMRNHLYRPLLEKVIDTMTNINKYSELFASLLERVGASLTNSVSDENIRTAYGNYMCQMIGDNKNILTTKIHPCKSEEELLEQLQEAFTELLAHDQRRVYRASFVEDFAFLKESNVALSANDIFTSFFSPAIKERGRLYSFDEEEGMLYCIMNSGTRKRLQEETCDQPMDAVGNQFIVNRNSEMERIYLYPIDPQDVRY